MEAEPDLRRDSREGQRSCPTTPGIATVPSLQDAASLRALALSNISRRVSSNNPSEPSGGTSGYYGQPISRRFELRSPLTPLTPLSALTDEDDMVEDLTDGRVSLDALDDDEVANLPLALQSSALVCIPGTSQWRKRVYWLTHRPEFEGFVIGLIFTNSLFLALDDPTKAEQPHYIVLAELIFTALFTVELLLKVVAQGFVVHPGSYLRSGWNRLDFIIVVLAYLAFLPGVGNYSAVRILRVLRPLRSINGIPGLKNIVNALFLSIKGLMHVLMLVTFFFFVFGILGVQLFMGLYQQRCVDPTTGELPERTSGEGQFCASSSVLGRRTCPEELECRDYRNPDYGYVSFDNIGWAFLVIFQCITLEGWVDQMYRVQDLWGALAPAYFIPLVILGSFFIVNLALAVIFDKFHYMKERTREQVEQEIWANMVETHLAKLEDEGGQGVGAAEQAAAKAFRASKLGWRVAVHRTTTSRGFQWMIIGFIAVNTIMLAMEHDGQPQELTHFLTIANFILTGIFTAEMVLKISAMGLKGYVEDHFNILDGFVVIVSLLELFLTSVSTNISVFRALRLLRVFKLMKNFKSLRGLVRVILKAVSDTGYLNLIMLLYLFIVALIGMQLFGGRFDFDPPPRATFDSFYWSLLTVFQILTRDDWLVPMWNAMRAVGAHASIYFVCLVILGDFIILNLFLAILINSFDRYMRPVEENADDCVTDVDSEDFNFGTFHSRRATDATRTFPELVYRPSTTLHTSHDTHSSDSRSRSGDTHSSEAHQALPGLVLLVPAGHRASHLSSTNKGSTDTSGSRGASKLGGAFTAYHERTLAHSPDLPATNGGFSLMVFGPKNTLRIYITYLVTHRYFERALLAAILVSSMLLAIEDPQEQNRILEGMNVAFTCLFIVELCLKVVAFGMVSGRGAYLRDGWNVLDASVVCVSVLSLIFSNFAFVKVFRALRALRPLRVVNRNTGLKVVVRTLLQALPGVANVAIVAFLIFLVFAILGVQLFSGRLYYCTDPRILERHECHGVHPDYYTVGADEPPVMRRWLRRDQNFDHIFASMLTLFEVSTLELWSQIMYHTIDSVGVDRGPERNTTPLAGIFFVCFIVIGSFFVMNLFVGVVIFNYNQEKKNMEGGALLSSEQERWIKMQRLMLTFRPRVKMPDEVYLLNQRRDNKLRRMACRLVNSPKFEMVIMGMIMINVLVMAMDHHHINRTWSAVLNGLNNACSAVFIMEAATKLYAWRTTYFRDSWNRFDFLLVILAVSGILLQLASTDFFIDPSVLRVFRIIRVIRIVRLIRTSRGMRVLLETLWYSLPYLSNIGLFLGLLFFIYATLGRNLFHSVRYGEYLSYHANFDHFWTALLLLFRTCTGENWNGIMHDLMVQPPDCTPDVDCGPPSWIPPVYFCTFLLIAAQVMFNLFIAIILDNFSTTIDIERSKVNMSDLNRFLTCWGMFDPDAKLLISTFRFPDLLVQLQPPLGVSTAYTRLELLRKVGQFQVPEHGGVVHFVEVLIPLARWCLEVELSDEEVREQEEEWRDHFPDLRALPTLSYRQKRATVDQFFAATYIGAAYRRSFARRLYLSLRQERMALRRRMAPYIPQMAFLKDRGTETDTPSLASKTRAWFLRLTPFTTETTPA
eukprot:Sspe_Gene.24208::Locus_9544_Transcript_1_1_Confidence_1.000_Length_4909::g.24208::m.24208/K04851/CACNA1D; voltage-dependent calcium channel L type alpha-1D